METNLKVSSLETDQLRREGLMKNKELTELSSTVTMEKSLQEKAVLVSLHALKKGRQASIAIGACSR